MAFREQVNLNNKNIREFTEKDTIYVQRSQSGFNFSYYCQFISFKSEIVKVRVLERERMAKHTEGEIFTTRLKKCYLWGNDGKIKNLTWNHCNWFNKEGFAK